MPTNDESYNNIICPYSYYSFQFFLLFPIVKLFRLIGQPDYIVFIFALGVPSLLYECIIHTFREHLTLVKHPPQPDHEHSSATTISVIIHSVILGLILSLGISFMDPQLENHFMPLGLYLISLTLFHWGEYFVTSITNPSTLTISSFLIYPSSAYVVAISGSLLEYLLEAFFFPGFKNFNAISMIGLCLAIGGELIRKMAMFTAGSNFTHTISSTRRPGHRLVTHGIYSLFRHPSYLGWFYWAIGTQILLLNPICFVIFMVISCNFFKDRIEYEEQTLLEFFEGDYETYRQRVGLWLPLKLHQDG